jgi:hypothetical protein
MAWEIPFEKFWVAQEVTPGTAVTPPTHDLNAAGSFVQEMSRVFGMDAGTLSDQQRSTIVRKGNAWSIERQPLNILLAPLILESAVAGTPVVTTPAGGTLSRLFTFTRDMLSTTLKSLTGYWGDPNLKMWQAPFATLEQLIMGADASGEDAVTWVYNGISKFPTALGSVPTAPTTLNPPLLIPGMTQLWIDTSSAIGTTEITDRLVSAELTIPTGNNPKYLAGGAAADLSYTRINRGKSHPSLALVFDMVDMTQYDLWAAGTDLKVRVRFNGPIIEGALRNYVEADIYGPFATDFSWGTLADNNRTFEGTIEGIKDATAGTDLIVRIQKNGATV